MLALKFHEKLVLAMAALAAIVGVWVLRTHDPSAPGNFFPQCMFKAITGFHCIGCGITRALHALVHGDIALAFAMNPLAVLVLPLLPLMLLDARGVTPQPLKPFMAIAMKPALWMVLLPAYWIGRNLPWWPFTWLAPG